jgi:hypothetical protein
MEVGQGTRHGVVYWDGNVRSRNKEGTRHGVMAALNTERRGVAVQALG